MAEIRPIDVAADCKTTIDIVDWLTWAGLEGNDIGEILSGLCERLLASGTMQVFRAHIAVTTLHPQFGGYGFTWWRDGGLLEPQAYPRADSYNDSFTRSPFYHMIDTKTYQLRRRLTGADAQVDFPILEEFRDAGATDWYAAAFPFVWRDGGDAEVSGFVTSWTTDAPDGFDFLTLARLQSILQLMALAVKAAATYTMAEGVLATYIGTDVAERVLSGGIERGRAETLDAALFYADLRGFTRLADTTERGQLVRMLDQYFDLIVEPVHQRGGQVLKYLGDGLLATFDLSSGDRGDVCGRALAAARSAHESIDRVNHQRLAAGEPTMTLDIALHLGEVVYGNIGARDRLEFTVIGPAVNEASRIEALCDQLDETLVMSGAFASELAAHGTPVRSLGDHTLRGVRKAQELFAPG